jgi:uncharacterized protein YidB (DUF937 family)
MGLLDMLNGMQNGSGNQRQAAPSGNGSGGMPPWMMAALGLLVYKATKGGGLGNMLGGATGGTTPVDPGADPRSSGGGLADIVGGLLGGGARSGTTPDGGNFLSGLLGAGAAGGVLSGGLRNLLGDLEQNGHSDAVHSWVGTGANQSISKSDLAKAVGMDDLDAVAQQTGMPREEVLSALSKHLPEFINQMTPDGRLPTEQEASRWV